jgi:hypothetical protein
MTVTNIYQVKYQIDCQYLEPGIKIIQNDKIIDKAGDMKLFEQNPVLFCKFLSYALYETVYRHWLFDKASTIHILENLQ